MSQHHSDKHDHSHHTHADHDHHHHGHSHDGHHHHVPDVTEQNQHRLFWAMILTGSFMIAEVVGGLISGSLALIADAGHMFSDFFSLGLSWLAFVLAKKKADNVRSYGYHRFQILAAFVNGLSLMVIAVWITISAINRLFNPVEVIASTMMVIAVLGLMINIVVFALLTRGESNNLNVQSAAMHVLGDLLGSVAAILAAIIIYYTGWLQADPLLSILVALLIVKGGWSITRQSAHILLEGTPSHIQIDDIKEKITNHFESVIDVHHVHLWSLTSEKPILTMHISHNNQSDNQQLLAEIHLFVEQNFQIDHVTIQMEHQLCTDKH